MLPTDGKCSRPRSILIFSLVPNYSCTPLAMLGPVIGYFILVVSALKLVYASNRFHRVTAFFAPLLLVEVIGYSRRDFPHAGPELPLKDCAPEQWCGPRLLPFAVAVSSRARLADIHPPPPRKPS
jgi:hypothetical protein